MLKIMKNKKADLAVTLLVFMAVALAGAASIIFLTSDRKIEERIADARFIDEIYMKEEQINFYINEIMDKAIETTKENVGLESNFEEDFPTNFLGELNKYKNKDGNYVLAELEQVEKQVNENPDIFVVEETTEQDKAIKKVTVEFQIIIEDKVTVKEKEIFSAVYTYKKKFEKQL